MASQGADRNPPADAEQWKFCVRKAVCLQLSPTFTKAGWRGNSFPYLHRHDSSVCRGRELSLQRDKQTDSKPASPLFCAWNSKTIEGAICNQKQNQTTGRAPCERFPLQSWLAFEQEQLLISSVRVKHSQHVCNCRNAPRRTKEIFPS